ncbi:MAG: NAD(+) synthase [Nitrosarchaeum sp.]|nr:NAD(+) synthase [Nitrosarchaeum sp.]
MDCNLIVNVARTELKNYCKNNNIQALVLGISGGIDSTLCAALARPVCDELGIKLIGRSIPIETNSKPEIFRANIVGDAFCHDFQEIDLTTAFTDLSHYILEDLTCNLNDKAFKIRRGNIKARMRMIKLYDLAGQHKGMVLSTDNYTEYLLGFSTIMGDWGDYGMIQYLWKTEVYDVAEWLSNNSNDEIKKAIKDCIEARATDGLGVTDAGDLGQIFPEWKGSSRDGYKEVDKILNAYVNFSHGDLEHPVIKRHNSSHFKRNWPIAIKRDKFCQA